MEPGRSLQAAPSIPFAGWMRHPTAMDATAWAKCLVAAAPPPGGLVADPFCGSGTTVAASTSRGLHAIGLESLGLFARLSAAKLTGRRDTSALSAAARQVVAEAIPASVAAEHGFVKRCFSTDILARLVALRNGLTQLQGPWSDHLWLALVASLRDHACVEVGWPHAQPDRPRAPRSTDPEGAFVSRVDEMAEELRLHPAGWSALGRVERRDARNPIAWSGLAAAGSIDAVITSPPYFTGFDYPDAVRLEALFATPGDPQTTGRARRSQIAASAHHASVRGGIDAYRELGRWPRTQGAARALSGALRNRRLSGHCRKPYDQLLPMYLRDLGRTFASLAPLLRTGARVGVVVAHSAPVGVAIPVPRLVERLCVEIGLRIEGTEQLRRRGQRWPGAPGRSEDAVLTEELVLLRCPALRSRPARRAGAALAPEQAAYAPAPAIFRTPRVPRPELGRSAPDQSRA
jgi:hypothetical protein